MNIFDIFNIKFATNISEEKKNEISEKIKNIKLYNILNLNPGILNQYIIVISCSSVYTKNFKKFNNSIVEYILSSDKKSLH